MEISRQKNEICIQECKLFGKNLSSKLRQVFVSGLVLFMYSVLCMCLYVCANGFHQLSTVCVFRYYLVIGHCFVLRKSV